MKIVFHCTNDVKNFVNDMMKLECDVNIVDGRRVLDAKSLLGVLNLDISKQFDTYCITDDENQRAIFNEIIKKYKGE